MKKLVEINYENIEKKEEYEILINKVVNECFEEENLKQLKLYISITLTVPFVIQEINKKYRNIDKETDVLSFPMFEKNEIEVLKKQDNIIEEVLGDIIISIPQVEKQAIEYNHSFERELAYMVVHGFFHLMGYDHIQEEDKIEMRKKEEEVLKKLNISR